MVGKENPEQTLCSLRKYNVLTRFGRNVMMNCLEKWIADYGARSRYRCCDCEHWRWKIIKIWSQWKQINGPLKLKSGIEESEHWSNCPALRKWSRNGFRFRLLIDKERLETEEQKGMGFALVITRRLDLAASRVKLADNDRLHWLWNETVREIGWQYSGLEVSLRFTSPDDDVLVNPSEEKASNNNRWLSVFWSLIGAIVKSSGFIRSSLY